MSTPLTELLMFPSARGLPAEPLPAKVIVLPKSTALAKLPVVDGLKVEIAWF